MKISDIGEFKFIERISNKIKIPSNDIIGIGDDCAVIPFDKDQNLLITTDMLVERIHFLKNKISPFDLGYKSLAVNISDIAAMGGIPHSAFISLGIPKLTDLSWLDEFYNGFNKLADEYNIYILGGDTTNSLSDIVINVAVIGFVQKKFLKLRSSAKVGDYICVTGFLGDSGAGLKILLGNAPIDENTNYLVNQHNRPRIHLKEGNFLSKFQSVHAMMDVSDGIDSDIRRIMERSNCGAEIYLEKLPLSVQLKNYCAKYDWNIYDIAATSGEDYCLLITVERESFSELDQKFEKELLGKIYHIGVITYKEKGLTYFLNNQSYKLTSKGFNHFL